VISLQEQMSFVKLTKRTFWETFEHSPYIPREEAKMIVLPTRCHKIKQNQI